MKALSLVIPLIFLASCKTTPLSIVSKVKLEEPIFMQCSVDGQPITNSTISAVGESTYITAAHSIMDECIPQILNRPYEFEYVDEDVDFAVVGPGRDFTGLSCSNLNSGVEITARGYAWGSNYLTSSEGSVAANMAEDSQWAFGFVEQGMSGGPVTLSGKYNKVYGIIRSKSEDGQSFQYVTGPAICRSLENLADAELPKDRRAWKD